MLSTFILPKQSSYYVTLLFSFLLCLNGGAFFSFSIFSSNLSHLLNTNNISIVGSMLDIGFFSSLLIGLIYYYTNSYFTITFSTVLCILGWLLPIYYNNFIFYCVCFFLIGLGSSGLQLVAISINSDNFNPKFRGSIVGIMMGGVAIAGIIWTLIYTYATNSNINLLFYLIAISTAIFGILGLLFIQPDINSIKETDIRRFSTIPFSQGIPAPALPSNSALYGGHKSSISIGDINEDIFIKKDMTGIALFQNKMFWMLFILSGVSDGIVLSWKNHIGQFGLPYETLAIILMMFLISNVVARFVVGFASDYFIAYVSRPMWLIIGSVIMSCGIGCFLAYPSVTTVYIATMCFSISYSIVLVVSTQLLTICYGMLYFGVNNGLICLGIMAGSFSITAMTNYIHNSTITKASCINNSLLCYRYPILLSLVLSFVPIIASIVVWLDYPVYLLFFSFLFHFSLNGFSLHLIKSENRQSLVMIQILNLWKIQILIGMRKQKKPMEVKKVDYLIKKPKFESIEQKA